MLNCGRYDLCAENILKLIRFFVMCLHQTKVTTVYHTLLSSKCCLRRGQKTLIARVQMTCFVTETAPSSSAAVDDNATVDGFALE